MFFYLTALVLTGLMLAALPKEAFGGEPVRMIMMVMLYSMVYFLFWIRKGREFIQRGFTQPFRAALILLILLNIFYIGATGYLSIEFLAKSLAVFLIPALLTYAFKAREGAFHPVDVVAFLLIYLFILMKVLPFPWVKADLAPGLGVTLNGDYSFLVLFLLFLYSGYRRIDLGLELRLTAKMVLVTLGLAAILIPVDIFVGVKLNFIAFSGFRTSLQNAGVMVVFMVFFATLSEELFFRGLIYNYLARFIAPKSWGKLGYLVPLLVSSVIFGVTHLDKFGFSMFWLATVAGLFYGFTYIKTKNLFCAVLIHTLTNLCWQLFFVTKG